MATAPQRLTFAELAKRDQPMRRMLIILVVFLVLPPVFSYFQDPYGWKKDQLQMMAIGFGGPYLVLGFLIVKRWRKLVFLAERGVHVTGTVEKAWSTRDGYKATIRYAFAGEEHRVTLELPVHSLLVTDGTSATLLVDPSNPRRASVVDVARTFPKR